MQPVVHMPVGIKTKTKQNKPKKKNSTKKNIGWNIMLLVDKGEKRVSVVGILYMWSKMLSSIASTILTFINTNYLVVYQKSL